MSTVQEALDLANPNSIADMFRKVSIGSVLAGLIPRAISRTGLASNTVQVEPEAGEIKSVESPAGTNLIIVGAGATPGVGEVAVAYDANGVATLTFQAAVTAYDVQKTIFPDGLGDALAEESGTAV